MAPYKFDEQFLFTTNGTRKYLTQTERLDFVTAARQADCDVQLLCLIVAETGCRLSEALALKPHNVDLANSALTFETLKRRSRGVYRQVPVSPELLFLLQDWLQARPPFKGRLFSIHRQTAWRWVERIMAKAKIEGEHATSRGLRHGFAVAAVQNDVPLNIVQKWLGHAYLATTAIYANAMGEEERAFAKRIWV